MINDGNRPLAALTFLRESASDCPVCGLGGAFGAPASYDTCRRCGWVDDPDDESLSAAQRSWPERCASRLSRAPVSRFDVVPRDDEIGGFDYVVDGVSVPLRTGAPVTPTGRARLYVCHLCGGDDYEASLTTDVRILGVRVVWSRIGLETYVYETDSWELDARRGPAGFAFDAAEYQRAFSG